MPVFAGLPEAIDLLLTVFTLVRVREKYGKKKVNFCINLQPSFPDMDVGGCHLLNFATLQVLVFVAVKEKAFNFLLAILKSPVVSPVFRHCKHELVSFMEFIQTRDATAPVLQMCKE